MGSQTRAALRELSRYYPDEPPVLADSLEAIIESLDRDGAALFVARAARLDHMPTAEQAQRIATDIYAERIARPGLARMRQALNPTTHTERHDAWTSERTAQSSTTE